MKLQGKVPVEQLDDERLTNIERKLVVSVSELRAPAAHAPRRLLAVAGMAMALAVAGFIGFKLRDHDAPLPAAEAPQTFAINTDKANTVQLGDVTLTTATSTDLTVERTRQRVVIEMRRGSLAMAVTHDPNRLLVVRAGDTEIEDVGTHFAIDYDGAAAVSVRVTEGEVKVKRAGKHENIPAGFAWTTVRGKLTIAALEQTQVAAVAVAQADEPAVTPAPAPVVVAPRPVAPAPAPPVTAPDSGSATPAPAPAPAPAPTPAPGAGSASVTHKAAGKSNARVALDKLPIEEPLDVGSKDLNTAIAKYLELALSMGDNQDKTQVLYSMAVMQHRAHQDKAALYTLTGVIKRQGGKAYKAALWLNVRIECMQHFDDECRQAADLYLRKVPDGVAAGVAQAILSEISRGP